MGDPAANVQDLAKLKRFAGKQGELNLEVRSVGTTDAVTWNFARKLVRSGGRDVLAAATDSTEAVTAKASATSASLPAVTTESIDLRPSGKLPATAQAAETGVVVSKADPPFTECGYPTKVADYGAQWTLVGQVYSTVATGYSAKFTYSAGASSSLGTAVSFSGGYGSFSANGTSSVSSTAVQTFPTFTGSGGRYYDTMFTYSLYKWHCAAYRGSLATGLVWTVWDEYHAKPTSFWGGTQTRSVASVSAGYCASFAAGSGFTKSTTTSQEWSNGVSLTNKIGLSLSSRTGYSNSASLSFTFSAKRKLCGTTGAPGGTPTRLQVSA